MEQRAITLAIVRLRMAVASARMRVLMERKGNDAD